MAKTVMAEGGAWMAASDGTDGQPPHYAPSATVITLLLQKGCYFIEDPRNNPGSDEAIPPFVPLGSRGGGQ